MKLSILEKIDTQENNQVVFDAVFDYYDYVDKQRINYNDYKHKLNEVLFADIYTLTISELLELDVNSEENCFDGLIKVIAEIKISEYPDGSDILDFINVVYNVEISGHIHDEDNLSINETFSVIRK